MATEVTKQIEDKANNMTENAGNEADDDISTTTFPGYNSDDIPQNNPDSESSSLYDMDTARSQYSSALDSWIRIPSSTESTGIQGSSAILNTADFFFTNLTRICAKIRDQIRRLAQDHVARDLFATAMDIILIIYAMGFLVLSMYQASIIG